MIRSRISAFDRRALLALALLVVVVALPYAFMGPGFIVDDWRFLARSELYGPFSAASDAKFTSRPGSWALIVLLHGLVGPHPLPIFVIQTLLNVLVVMALYLVAKRFISPCLAAAVAAVWAIFPNHTTLSYWPAVANGTVALLLLIVGVGFLDARRWTLAGAAIDAVPAFRHQLRPRPSLALLAAMAVTGSWMALHSSYPLDQPLANPDRSCRRTSVPGSRAPTSAGTCLRCSRSRESSRSHGSCSGERPSVRASGWSSSAWRSSLSAWLRSRSITSASSGLPTASTR